MPENNQRDFIASLYPGTSTVSYLDSAAVGLISTRVRDAMLEVIDSHVDAGIAATIGWRERAEEVRDAAAELVNGDPMRLSFTQNTSTGLALVANGVDWQTGDNIVVPEAEFPSNFYPWLQLRCLGVEVRTVPMDEGFARLESVRQAMDHRTRVVAISAVQYSTGYRYDLAQLGELSNGTDALLVVDATQCLGALTIDADAAGIDVLAVSAHKWMLGPFGIGFVHFSEKAMNALTPSTTGWLSVENPFDFTREPQLAKSAKRFESGTENSAGIAGIGATIGLILQLGRQWVERDVLGKAEHLSEILRSCGMTVERPGTAKNYSGIVIASSTSEANSSIHERLLANGIQCSLRGNGVRFSPHYFNSEDDILRVAASIRATS